MAHAIVDGTGPVRLAADVGRLDPRTARLVDGTPVTATADDRGVVVELPDVRVPGPVVVDLDVRRS